MKDKGKVLVIGSNGQIGTELVDYLTRTKGHENVVSGDISKAKSSINNPFEYLDVTDYDGIVNVIKKYDVKEVYNLAALLSATSEKNPEKAWDLNMAGLFNLLNAAREGLIDKVFWPSSIAVFGQNTPDGKVPQHTVTDPTSVYGISKLAGERWCEYYHKRWGVDVRSIRFAGLIGYKSMPGGGTTDYAVDIFHQALDSGTFTCFLKSDTALPMMYMGDAIKATIQLMDAPKEAITIRSSYNLDGLSFTPAQLAAQIKEHLPNFEISYDPDYRQEIAQTWPDDMDGTQASMDWGWKSESSINDLVSIMLEGVKSSRNLLPQIP